MSAENEIVSAEEEALLNSPAAPTTRPDFCRNAIPAGLEKAVAASSALAALPAPARPMDGAPRS